MPSAKNISGQRFGRLVALRPTEKRKNGFVVWECQCDCGNTAFILSANLLNGNTQSCGCLRWDKAKSRQNNITGQRFGKLVALRPTEKRKNRNVMWECQCDCGNITFVRSRDLVNGNTKSCGCLRKSLKLGKKFNDLSGQRFGKLIALRPTEERKYGNVVWECRCDCGNTAFVPSGNLSNGRTVSCGCKRKRKK